jgi:hypothetical protein
LQISLSARCFARSIRKSRIDSTINGIQRVGALRWVTSGFRHQHFFPWHDLGHIQILYLRLDSKKPILIKNLELKQNLGKRRRSGDNPQQELLYHFRCLCQTKMDGTQNGEKLLNVLRCTSTITLLFRMLCFSSQLELAVDPKLQNLRSA